MCWSLIRKNGFGLVKFCVNRQIGPTPLIHWKFFPSHFWTSFSSTEHSPKLFKKCLASFCSSKGATRFAAVLRMKVLLVDCNLLADDIQHFLQFQKWTFDWIICEMCVFCFQLIEFAQLQVKCFHLFFDFDKCSLLSCGHFECLLGSIVK